MSDSFFARNGAAVRSQESLSLSLSLSLSFATARKFHGSESGLVFLSLSNDTRRALNITNCRANFKLNDGSSPARLATAQCINTTGGFGPDLCVTPGLTSAVCPEKTRPLSSRYLVQCRCYMFVSSVIKCDYITPSVCVYVT